ncbi:unnamed protein product [Lampetra planeri]
MLPSCSGKENVKNQYGGAGNGGSNGGDDGGDGGNDAAPLLLLPLPRVGGEQTTTTTMTAAMSVTSSVVRRRLLAVLAVVLVLLLAVNVCVVWSEYNSSRPFRPPAPARPRPGNASSPSSTSTSSTSSSSSCSSVAESWRFDCYPERGAVVTEAMCAARNCCYVPVVTGEGGTNGGSRGDGIGVPWCFYGPGYGLYMAPAGGWVETALGMEGNLTLVARSPYPRDVATVRLSVAMETDSRLRIRLTDASAPRFEVPVSVPNVSRRAPSQLYRVELTQELPGILVVRRSTGAVLINTTVAPLVFADQFLSLSTRLPSTQIYGLGEHRAGLRQNVNWNRLSFWARDNPPTESTNLYGAHPFYLALEAGGAAHGVFLLNSNAMDVVLQPAPAVTWRTIGGILDLYVLLGPTPDAVVQQYTEVVGRPALPPYWALGFHLCRWGYNSSDGTMSTVRAMRAAGIPQDAQWNDIEYMHKRLVFTYDTKAFASLPAMVQDLHAHGQKYVVILDPGVSSSQPRGTYPAFDVALARGLFINNTDGTAPLIGKVWPGETAFPDFTNRATRQWWSENLKSLHDLVPFDGLWIDMNEPSNFVDGSVDGCPNNELENPPYTPAVQGDSLKAKTICASARQSISSHYNLHNLYGLTEAMVSYSAMEELRGRRPLIISRSTFPSHGHYAGHWLGDNRSTWKDLACSIAGVLNFNLFGVPLVGADICGFNGDTMEELCVRWMQLGAFYPFSRNHNTIGAAPQDPTVFSAAAQAAMRRALLTRYSLLPLLYSLFMGAHQSGSTVARPLFFEFPHDEQAYAIDRQLLWGPALLVSPALEEGARSVQAYLPAGTWYDFYTGSAIRSKGENFTLDAPLDKINLHLRAGFIVPTQVPDTTSSASRRNPLGIVAALRPPESDEGDDGGEEEEEEEEEGAQGDLFWDDGDTPGPLQSGRYWALKFKATQGTLHSTVLHAAPGTPLPPLGSVSVMGVPRRPSRVRLNGGYVSFSYSSSTQVLSVSNLTVPLSEAITLEWQ